ncbi:hypothetical protein HanPI659440_Chr04g0170691 [Helianthus annuus]|nr:hypothetical protein HanPI659440_Chr04g0170691 [Helianthus annuus]
MVPEKNTSPEQDRGGRRGRTGVTKGGPHVLVRRKRLNSDGEDGTEGDGGAAAWEDGGDVAAPREDEDGDGSIPFSLILHLTLQC